MQGSGEFGLPSDRVSDSRGGNYYLVKPNRIWDTERFVGHDSGCIHGNLHRLQLPMWEEVIDGACLTTDFDDVMPVDKLHFELIIPNQLWGETDRRDRGELG